MLPVTLVYGVGIILADRCPLLCPLWPLLDGSILLTVIALFWPARRPLLLWFLFAAMGMTNLSLHQAVLSPHDLRRLIGEEPCLASIRGRLTETPYQRVHDQKEQEVWRTLAEIEVSEIQMAGGRWQPAHGRLLASTAGVLPSIYFGGRAVEIEGVARPPRTAVAEGVFDYRAFLRRQGIHYQLLVASTNHWRNLEQDRRPPLSDRFCAWARTTLARGLPEPDSPLQLLWAMTLGWKTALSGEVSEPFIRSGTMHVFAISGLHIALITTLLVACLRVLRCPRWLCGLLVIPLAWGYTGVTGWQASAIRSTVMATVILAGWSLRRPSDLLNSLAAAAFVILLWDPEQLFQASFQLSFSVVLSLALLGPRLDALRRRWLAPEPWIPDDLRPRWQRWLGVPLDYLTISVCTSLAAWLGSAPMIAYYFHLLTPASLPANLVVVPLSSAALACNLASLATGAWLPGATSLFNHAAWWFMVLMIKASVYASEFPGGALHTPAPSMALCALYYLALASALSPPCWERRRRRWTLGTLGLLSVSCLCQWFSHRNESNLCILPLQGGEAVFIQPATGKDLLLDCGNEAAVQFVVKPFLRAQGVNRLDQFALTHGDVHNVGGASAVQALFGAREVFVSKTPFRSPVYREQLGVLESIPRLVHPVTRGDQLGPWRVLHPAAGDRLPQAADNTLVLCGHLNGCRVLLLSDLGKPGQHLLLSRENQLAADVVVAGLPNQSEPLAEALLDAVDPQLIVVTDSEYPATQRASPKLRARLESHGIPILYTRDTGAITLTSKPGSWSVRTMNGILWEFPE